PGSEPTLAASPATGAAEAGVEGGGVGDEQRRFEIRGAALCLTAERRGPAAIAGAAAPQQHARPRQPRAPPRAAPRRAARGRASGVRTAALRSAVRRQSSKARSKYATASS